MQGNTELSSAAEILASAIADGLAIQPVNIDPMRLAAPLVGVPANLKLVSLEEYLPRPSLIKAKHTTRSMEDFIEYVLAYKDDHSLIIANFEDRNLTCVLDYHAPAGDEEELPGWCRHQVVYDFTLSDEMNDWSAFLNKYHNHQDFGEFIEDHLNEIVEPDSATMLEIARKFAVDQNSKYKTAQVLQNGDISLVYERESVSNTMKIPSAIKVALPVFAFGLTTAQVECTFRYRLREGALSMMIRTNRPIKRDIDFYMDDALVKIKAATGLRTIRF